MQTQRKGVQMLGTETGGKEETMNNKPSKMEELVLDVGKRSLVDHDRFLRLLCTIIGPRVGDLGIARDVCRGILYMLATDDEVAKAHAAAFGEQDRIEKGPK